MPTDVSPATIDIGPDFPAEERPECKSTNPESPEPATPPVDRAISPEIPLVEPPVIIEIAPVLPDEAEPELISIFPELDDITSMDESKIRPLIPPADDPLKSEALPPSCPVAKEDPALNRMFPPKSAVLDSITMEILPARWAEEPTARVISPEDPLDP